MCMCKCFNNTIESRVFKFKIEQCYRYDGHGSGLQYISSYETSQITTNAVIFLIGCSSIAFRADHGYAFGTATHHYYHLAKRYDLHKIIIRNGRRLYRFLKCWHSISFFSQAVIGNLNLSWGFWNELVLNTILGKWLSPVNLGNIDPSQYPDSGRDPDKFGNSKFEL